jgi:hypothetical protein
MVGERAFLIGGGGLLAVLGSSLVGYSGAGPLGCIVAAFVASYGWKLQGWSSSFVSSYTSCNLLHLYKTVHNESRMYSKNLLALNFRTQFFGGGIVTPTSLVCTILHSYF